jgi:hypothetical protein
LRWIEKHLEYAFSSKRGANGLKRHEARMSRAS